MAIFSQESVLFLTFPFWQRKRALSNLFFPRDLLSPFSFLVYVRRGVKSMALFPLLLSHQRRVLMALLSYFSSSRMRFGAAAVKKKGKEKLCAKKTGLDHVQISLLLRFRVSFGKKVGTYLLYASILAPLQSKSLSDERPKCYKVTSRPMSFQKTTYYPAPNSNSIVFPSFSMFGNPSPRVRHPCLRRLWRVRRTRVRLRPGGARALFAKVVQERDGVLQVRSQIQNSRNQYGRNVI